MSYPQISELLRHWPTVEIPTAPFSSLVCERLRLALQSLRETPEQVGAADLATLIRQVLRHEGAEHGVTPRVQVPLAPRWPTKAQWRAHGCHVSDGPRANFCTVQAAEWRPDWLNAAPFAAVERNEIRRAYRPIPADPAVAEILKVKEYLSAAQADALRAVVLAPPGSVSIVALPTGAGKSMVGLAAAALGQRPGVSIVVVPTIALAYDQVLQSRAAMPKARIDWWKADLTTAERNAIRDRIRSGEQRLLYAAPESVVGALAGALCDAAARGWLRAFIVDEAHLVAQWGHAFRPDFQAMGGLWHQLRRCAAGEHVFRTVLMTATLTEDSHRTLRTFFGPAKNVETLASVYLRPEPDFFVRECAVHMPEQRERVLEALRHGPRPAILYVTSPHDADRWHRVVRELGWRRSDCIHGGTEGARREERIDRWRKNETDLMVATSAFGLGMDKSDVGLVLHACVPETVDRYYQEVGRGGRDGRACVSMLLWTQEDCEAAHGLSAPKIIGEELGMARWNAMKRESKWDGEIMLADLRAVRPGVTWEGDTNMAWNMKTLLLLARAGALQLESRAASELPRMETETDEQYEARWHAAMEEHWAICPVRVHDGAALARTEYWQTTIAARRDETLESARQNWRWMQEVLSGHADLSRIFREVYRVPAAGIEVADDAAPLSIRPPARLCDSAPRLQEIARGSAILLATYPAERDWKREMVRRLRVLVKAGLRELAVPESLLKYAGMEQLHRDAPERFVIVRALCGDETAATPPWPLPRVSVIEPGGEVTRDLLGLERPLHLLLFPAGTPDPRHPQRKLGDDQRPPCRSWNQFETLLSL